MTIEEAIVALMAADNAAGGVNALVAGRYYANLAIEGEPNPKVVFQRISGPTVASMDGAGDLNYPRIQISAIAGDYPSAKALHRAIGSLLNGFRGTVIAGSDSIVIQSCLRVDERDMPSIPADDQAMRDFVIQSDYVIWAVES
jgi:hypothetical protein